MGDYIGDNITTNISGDNNQNIVKSQISNSFNIELSKKVDELKEAINTEYSGEDKTVLLKQVEEIKSLATEKKNFPKIRETLGVIMTKTAEVATIATVN